MRGGGDSAGIGTSPGTNRVLGPSDEMPVANANGTATGGETVNVAGAGAHVEQQIEPCEHSP